MKHLLIKIIFVQSLLLLALLTRADAQTTAIEKKTDTIAKLAIRYMNLNKPDSVYQLTGDFFRSQIPAATWNSIYSNQLSAIMPFTKVEFVSSSNSVNIYKLTGGIVLTYSVSLDAKNKIVNFAFVPYKE